MGLAGPVETTLLGAEWVGRLGSAIRVTNHDQMSHPGDSWAFGRTYRWPLPTVAHMAGTGHAKKR